MNKDVYSIFEAYNNNPRAGDITDKKNYVPSLEEIRKELEQVYNKRIASYSSKGSELQYAVRNTKESLANIDKISQEIKDIIDKEKKLVDEWNSEIEGTGRTPYTLWDALYSYVSDISKSVDGYRFRTSFEKTPTIEMAELYRKYQLK